MCGLWLRSSCLINFDVENCKQKPKNCKQTAKNGLDRDEAEAGLARNHELIVIISRDFGFDDGLGHVD